MRSRRWGTFLCDCRGTQAVDVERMDIPGSVTLASDPDNDLAAFVDQVRADDLRQVLVGCCAAREMFEEALAPLVGNSGLHFVDLRDQCFGPHADAAQAHAKAERLIRGAMRGAEATIEIPSSQLRLGGRVLIHAEIPSGLELPPLLGDMESVTVYVPPGAQGFGDLPPGRINPGRITSINGRLGAFKVTVAEWGNGSDAPSQLKPLELDADQVVLVVAEAPPNLKQRTGIYILQHPGEDALRTVAAEIQSLVGLFEKPEHVAYDPGLCAGGAASMQTCGLCITHCPYDAISRSTADPLRIAVDHMTCEGCGACASACPTSALKFTDPSPRALQERLEALLAPAEDGAAAEAPPVVVFHCGEVGQRVLEAAGQIPLPYPASVLPVAVPCLRYVSESNMLSAIRLGAAGAALLGCEDCPNGERELLIAKQGMAGAILDAFGLDSGRVRIITARDGEEADAISALTHFAGSVSLPGIARGERPPREAGNREVLAHALDGFIQSTGKSPGGIEVPDGLPFAFADVEDKGCTLCRSCVTVCPTHAFKFEEETQTLSFKHIACVACGLCEQACPENVISLRPELYLDAQALNYLTVVEDETMTCTSCETPFINRRALETIEAKVFGLESLGETFAGERRKLLRMCPDCRAAHAILEVDKGWVP